MRKTKLLLGLGLLVTVMPYLGFPFALRNLLVSLCGLGVMYIGLLMYNQYKRSNKETYETFSENDDFVEASILSEAEQ